MILAVLAAASLCPSAAAPAMTVPSALVLHGDPLSVRLTGLRPRSIVAVTASRPTGWGRPRVQTARATFRADACGTVNATGDVPLDGTWSGSDPRALFWSMKATDDTPAAGWTQSEVRIAADTNADGASDLAANIRFADDPRPEIPLGDAFPGAFFMTPPGIGPYPAIVLMGGSEGGDQSVRARAPQFTARGYAVVGLPYYAPSYGAPSRFPALPAAFWNIPVDRMEGVLGWLRARADVDGARIGMFGVSKGAEFALAAASRLPGIAAVAAIVPSDVIWEGWGPGTATGQSSGFSWRGTPLAFVPYQGMDAEITKLTRGEPGDLRRAHDAGRAAFGDRIAPARIAVEAIAAPVLVAGGNKDRTWDSGGMASAIGAARRAAGLPTVALVFPDAGHSLSGDGMAPDTPSNARAQSVVYAATLAFFERYLRPERARVEP